THRQEVNLALEQTPKVIRLLRDLQQRYPTLFKKLLLTAAKELLIALPSGVSAEDVAFFVGRVIKGAVGYAPDLTFGALLKTVATVAGLVGATHLPGIAAHAVEGAAATKATELQKDMKDAGYTVTEAEAAAILGELRSGKDATTLLRDLETACKALLPSLEMWKKASSATPCPPPARPGPSPSGVATLRPGPAAGPPWTMSRRFGKPCRGGGRAAP